MMRDLLGMSADEMNDVFGAWNDGDLNSYLIEITRDILAYKDADGQPLVNRILDTAGQKGTGKWTGIAALDEGVPLTLIGEAVFARCLSAMKDERVAASKVFAAPADAIRPVDVVFWGPFAFVEGAAFSFPMVALVGGAFFLFRKIRSRGMPTRLKR